jgi:VIT1/CCC1 family predicted Fe2+/Mn2+ transporter
MPYIVLSNIYSALMWSVLITLVALAIFGYIKGHATGVSPLRSAMQTTLTGGLAAAAAFALARLFSNR